MRRKWLLLYLIVFTPLIYALCVGSNTSATGGNLETSSIVTCNGNTYGSHNGHWHLAKKNKNGVYYAADPKGEKSTNPCNSSSTGSSDSSSNSEPSTSRSETSTSTDSSTTNNNQNTQDSPSADSATSEQTINDEEQQESVVIEDQTNSITLELRLWINGESSPIRFDEDNCATKTRTYWQQSFDYTYELSSNDASMIVKKDGEQINGPIDLGIGDNKIEFIVKDANGQETTFELNIKRNNLVISIIVMFLSCVMAIALFGVLASVINTYIIVPRKKKGKEKVKTSPKQFFKSLVEKENALKILLPPVYIIKKKRTKQKISKLVIGWLIFWVLIILVSVISCVIIPTDNRKNSANSYPSATIKVSATQFNTVEEKTQDKVQNDIVVEEATEDLMSGITIKEAINATYSRDEYEPSWSVGSGCDIRARILKQTSTIAVQTSSNGCTVTYGSWVDPYTGATLTGNPYRGDDGTGNDLDIDHIIPLKYVNSHGGSEWSSAQKRSYGSSLSAMEKGVYVAVSATENRKKSDSGPSEYYPPNANYRCEYAQKWRDIAREYQISLSSSDFHIIQNILTECTNSN